MTGDQGVAELDVCEPDARGVGRDVVGLAQGSPCGGGLRRERRERSRGFQAGPARFVQLGASLRRLLRCVAQIGLGSLELGLACLEERPGVAVAQSVDQLALV